MLDDMQRKKLLDMLFEAGVVGAPRRNPIAFYVDQLIAQARADERARCANYCGLLAEMMEQGAGELTPGGRLRQAEQTILADNHGSAQKDSTT